MPFTSRLAGILQFKSLENKPIIIVAVMSFFWTIFDGMLSFAAPILMTRNGLTESVMGIVLGTSSVAGIFFDLILCHVLKNTNFRRMYLLMIIFSSLFPLLLWQSKTIFLFILAMSLWGLYYDFFSLGNFDFISRYVNKGNFSSSFGLLSVFVTLGYFFSPIIAGFLIGEEITAQFFLVSWACLGLSGIFLFLLFFIFNRKDEKPGLMEQMPKKSFGFLKELRLWKKIGNFILPILFLTFFLNVIDAFYWTVGPLLSEKLNMDGERGVFMMTFLLPSLIAGWVVGKITKYFGKKRTAFISLICGSLFLIGFVFIKNSFFLIIINLIASFFIALSLPAINGAYADYISESPKLEKEIETLEDSFTNLGYVVGPVAAGFISQYFGYTTSFSLLGVCGLIVGFILFYFTPKKINLKIKNF